MRIRLLTRMVLLLAAIKIAATLLVLLHSGSLPNGLHFAYVLCFSVASLLLFTTGAGDPRAFALGGFFLVMANAFCRSSLLELAKAPPGPWPDLVHAAGALALDGFLPLFFWMFVRTFPETPVPRRVRRLMAAGITASAWVGSLLGLATLAAALAGLEGREVASFLAPRPGGGIYDLMILLLLLPTLPILVYKARLTRGEEARRVQLFVTAIVLALAPALIEIAAEYTFHRYKIALGQNLGGARERMRWRVSIFLLPLPAVTSYAVLVHRVLPVRFMARRALQYTFARYSTLVLAAIPGAALCAYVYIHRELSIREFLYGPQLLLILMTLLLAWAAPRYRVRLLDAIDRRFFREQYDARRILTMVVQQLRGTHQVLDIAELLCRGIDQALHLQAIAVLVEDPRSGNLVDPRSRARKLDASSALAQRIASATDPLFVDLGSPRGSLAKLPEDDRRWLTAAGFRLLVPTVARDGSLIGVICLGDKKSGLPFLKEDRKLLVDIANTAALRIELELKQTWSPRGHEDDSRAGFLPETEGAHPPENAKECLSCGALYLPYTVICTNCSRRLEPSVVPYLLPGKFRFERRLGAGGMGVVYRGIDMALGRAVAVKTLKRVSPEDAMRLRREARTAAAVSHRHLAAVYGLETWQGTPLLVMELMEGGTLTQRIAKGPLSARETVDLGIAMAEALEHLHAADILHRDVKPSNIGYTRDSVPKLMDFGIARVLLDLRPERNTAPSDFDDGDSTVLPPTSIWDHSPTSITWSRQLVGTLSYLSPEALSSEAPNTSFDLWGLAVVLYECILGRKLFAGMDMKQTMARIRQGRVPDYEQTCPDLDPAMGRFFRSALHRTPSRRPGSARDMRRRLEEVRSRLTEPLPPEGSP
ncbi:MAG: eukaryotic-like serine/threonine-protein kinase [Acidobacteriota bacterium]|nr:eukaryotic-like serine/threonine-protein kinase [Acidobacteriota bacterium]